MADDTIPKAEFLSWVPAYDAVRNVPNTTFDVAAHEIVRRASLDFLVARFEKGAVTKRGQTVSLTPYTRIGDNAWKKLLRDGNIGGDDLWFSNTLEVRLELDEGHKTFQLFGVRFDPVGLDELTPKRVVPVPVAPFVGGPFPDDGGPEQKGKPVTAPALKIWAEAFAKIHKGEDVPQPLAIQSAEGMFPDKSVSRDRITAALKAAGVTFRRGPRKQITGE